MNRISEFKLPTFLRPPDLVTHKRRVSRTIYSRHCPICAEVATGWDQDTREDPARRTYKPCGCVWQEGGISDIELD